MVGGRGEKNFSKKSCGQKILIIKSGCIMERVNFLKGLQEVFGENRKLHNCSTIN